MFLIVVTYALVSGISQEVTTNTMLCKPVSEPIGDKLIMQLYNTLTGINKLTSCKHLGQKKFVLLYAEQVNLVIARA